VILCRTDTIAPEDLQLPNEKRFFATDVNGKTFHDMIDIAERQIISDTLSKLNWDKEKAAELLNISRASLYNKIKKHKIQTIIPDDM